MQQFMEFVDRKQREAIDHLELIEKIFKKTDMEVKPHLDDENPYIYIKSPDKKLSFEGIRIYQIGDMIAYRVQKQEKTEPYGKTYSLNIEDMFNDFMSENMSEDDATEKVMKSIVDEIKKFFRKSAQAEEEIRTGDKDGLGLIVKTGGTDYSSTVVNRM
jgi:hypothetical protein